MNHIVVYGGQYGSEGKASAAEYWAKQFKRAGKPLFVFGENGPNSGHTSTLGTTRAIPASSFWADAIVLGPDSVVSLELLVRDWKAVGERPLFIHRNAAVCLPDDGGNEHALNLRISSTASGTGFARYRKFFQREVTATVASAELPAGIELVDTSHYLELVARAQEASAIFECSQGVLLDTSFGDYPYVTSRTTLPRAAIERNGLGALPWKFAGVFRTHPIRVHGPSGTTGGEETSFEALERPPELTTVTRKVRRIFKFSYDDFMLSLVLARPDLLMFTFIDYLREPFEDWLRNQGIWRVAMNSPTFFSGQTGFFGELRKGTRRSKPPAAP